MVTVPAGRGVVVPPGAVAVRLAAGEGKRMRISFMPGSVADIDFTEEIDAGAAWLAGHDPRWFDKINLDNLHLESPRTCVLGQLAMTSFTDKVRKDHIYGYDLVLTAFGLDTEWACDHGFSVSTGEAAAGWGCDPDDWHEVEWEVENNLTWEALTLQWVQRIEKARAEAGTAA